MAEWLITADEVQTEAKTFVATKEVAATIKKGFMDLIGVFSPRPETPVPPAGFRAVSTGFTLRRPVLRGSELLALKALARDIYAVDPEAIVGPRETIIGSTVQKHIVALRSGGRPQPTTAS